ncbi:MAG TPA: hypothetical protein VLM43_00545 [Desulfobacterales bacterium]|nr:hypothetical protein [Desulfobacterales bacterium]
MPLETERVPFITLSKENNIRKGFFEHWEFLALRDALPSNLKGLKREPESKGKG